jgi:NAD-dependent dihydropyrimidine dehydrogenase PreA subunit
MFIDQTVCAGCEECIPYCPVEAIKSVDGAVTIDFDECVECTACMRFANCPVEAIKESPETALWPRAVRRQFSDPTTRHPSTRGPGRGTAEMKTNDVTNKIKPGEIGVGLEFGRPGIASRLYDMEKMTVALAKLGCRFEPENPVTFLLTDPATGVMKPEVRNERVLSAIIEAQMPAAGLAQLVPVIHEVARHVDTVISWEIVTRLNDDGSIPIMEDLKKLGTMPRPNAKINLGMGRPYPQR